MHEAATHNFLGGLYDRYGLVETRRVVRAAELQWRTDGWQRRATAPDKPNGEKQRQMMDVCPACEGQGHHECPVCRGAKLIRIAA